MHRRDIHEPHEFFEYLRLEDSVPEARRDRIDVAILDMNHAWPNVGHDSLVHAVLEAAESLRGELRDAGLKVRTLSFDVRRRLMLPDAPNGRYQLYIGTGGPGYLDPRENDGVREFSQGIAETDAWEAPLFRLFDDIVQHPTAALIGICHSFGLMCRWSGAAHPRLREAKSEGMPLNTLTAAAGDHPWFARFASELPDGRRFRVVDNRLFDLAFDGGSSTPIAFESDGSDAVTTAEFARLGDMPRVYGVNHHPEIIDREHVLAVVEEKWQHGEVSRKWYEERLHTLENVMKGENVRQSRLTSQYMLLAPLRFHLERLLRERAG
ncbi:MAG TPA: hypothetical protein VJ276_00510 [Thermoanaerobaculia bacterium]|nr:hypothetical protein [Thermoanaerobaculia bacterium]